MRNTISPSRKSAFAAAILAIGLTASLSLAGCSKAKDETAKDTPSTQKNAPVTKPASGTETPTPPNTAAAENSLAGAAGTYDIDAGHSHVLFRITHLGVSSSYGQFIKIGGTFTLDADPAKSSVELTIDAASIFTADKKRDEHLKSPDFLNVQQFPTITFKSTSVKALDEKKYEVVGDLSLHGVTKPVTVTMEHIGAGVSPADNKTFLTGFEGEFTIKRSEFGMNYMPGALGEDIRVIVAVEGARQ